VKNKTKT